MAHYNFTTVWDIEAPIEDVWEQLIHSENWPEWWPAVQSVLELEKGDEPRSNGFWGLSRMTFSTPIHRYADGQVV